MQVKLVMEVVFSETSKVVSYDHVEKTNFSCQLKRFCNGNVTLQREIYAPRLGRWYKPCGPIYFYLPLHPNL